MRQKTEENEQDERALIMEDIIIVYKDKGGLRGQTNNVSLKGTYSRKKVPFEDFLGRNPLLRKAVSSLRSFATPYANELMPLSLHVNIDNVRR